MIFKISCLSITKISSRGRRLRPSTRTEGTVSHNTDRPGPVNNNFFFLQLRFKSFRRIFLHSPTLEVGHVRVDEARDRLQTKAKHYNMIFSSVIYIIALTTLF